MEIDDINEASQQTNHGELITNMDKSGQVTHNTSIHSARQTNAA